MSMPNEAPGNLSEINAANILESSSSSSSNTTKEAAKQLTSKGVFPEEKDVNHLKRLENLRKELNYIEETEWMYESLDKKPQQ